MERAAGTIFISYRREDARADAGRLYDRLDARYPGRVFRDVGSIEPGADWRKTITDVLRSTAACIVVIGPEWLTIADENGRRRLDDPDDMLRAEVASALASACRVFPVLVGEADTPARSRLPHDLKPLASRNAIELSEQDFDAGFQRLVKALDRVFERPTWRTARLRIRLAAAAAVAAIVALAVAYTIERDGSPDGAASSQAVTPSPSSGAGAPSTDSAAQRAAVGQITLRWTGVNSTSWQVVDESKRGPPRYLAAGAGVSETADFGAGRYLVVLADKPEIGSLPATVIAGQATVVAPEVGQVTFHWTGATAILWQLLDEKSRAALRHAATGPGGSETVDIGTGRYLLVIPDMPEIAPVPITVAAGRMSTVAPQVGRVTVEWRGAQSVAFKVIDAKRRHALRTLYLNPSSSQTTDMAPGHYLIVPQGTPDLKPIEVTVADGEEVRAGFG